MELLEEIELEGVEVTEKSAACVPLMVTYGVDPVRFKAAVPIFCIKKDFATVSEETSALPKSVSATVKDMSPSGISRPFSPCTLISGAVDSVPVPSTAKSYGFFVMELLMMLIPADRTPVPSGSNLTLKVVVPPLPATVDDGIWVTVNSDEFVPVMTTLLIVSVELPVFSIVNVLSTLPLVISAEPKSVPSADLGTVLPFLIKTLFPYTFRSRTGLSQNLLPLNVLLVSSV